MNVNTAPHNSVMTKEVLKYLEPKDRAIYVDCTFGGGGHTSNILRQSNCQVIAIDQDPEVIGFANEIRGKFGNRFTFIQDNFVNITNILQNMHIMQVDGFIFDLGVSSMQLMSNRGFSFSHSAELDMRMDKDGQTAADFINTASESQLADVIYHYGGERASRKIAKKIVKTRANAPITDAAELANIVRTSIGHRKSKIDLATKTFQAIRIFVNKELDYLNQCLLQIANLLKVGGRLAVISFHSAEDVIVKQYLKDLSHRKVAISKYAKTLPTCSGVYKILTKKPISPQYEEIKNNRRARSAKLRAAIKVGKYYE